MIPNVVFSLAPSVSEVFNHSERLKWCTQLYNINSWTGLFMCDKTGLRSLKASQAFWIVHPNWTGSQYYCFGIGEIYSLCQQSILCMCDVSRKSSEDNVYKNGEKL